MASESNGSKSRVLIGDWNPPSTDNKSKATSCAEPAEESKVKVYNDSNDRALGIRYQRCGGGVRIIRKSLGNL